MPKICVSPLYSAIIPLPANSLKLQTSPLISPAFSFIAFAIGWFEFFSITATISRSLPLYFFVEIIFVTLSSPLVKVPVLSKTTVSQED